jgi:hypothetical protein
VRDLIRQVAPDSAAEPLSGERAFTVDGRDWVARIAGEGVGGTGARGGAYLVAIRFYPAHASARSGDEEVAREQGRRGAAVREALLPRGRFRLLYDEELVELFRSAKPIPPPSRG